MSQIKQWMNQSVADVSSKQAFRSADDVANQAVAMSQPTLIDNAVVLVNGLRDMGDHIIQEFNRIDAEKHRCDTPSLVYRKVPGSRVANHYGVCFGCAVVDFNVAGDSGVGWQTKAFAAVASSGVLSASVEASVACGITSAALTYEAQVAAILEEFWGEVASVTCTTLVSDGATVSEASGWQGSANSMKSLDSRNASMEFCMPRDVGGRFSKGHNTGIKLLVKTLLTKLKIIFGKASDAGSRELLGGISDAAWQSVSESSQEFLEDGITAFMQTVSQRSITSSNDWRSIVSISVRSLVAIFCPAYMALVAIVEYLLNISSAVSNTNAKLQQALKKLEGTLQKLAMFRYGSAVVMSSISAMIVARAAQKQPGVGLVRIITADEFENGSSVRIEHTYGELGLDEGEVQVHWRILLAFYKQVLFAFDQKENDFVQGSNNKGVQPDPITYELVTSNCEHFAKWIFYGEATSIQAKTAAASLIGLGSSMGLGAFASCAFGHIAQATVLSSATLAKVFPVLIPWLGTPAGFIDAGPSKILPIAALGLFGGAVGGAKAQEQLSVQGQTTFEYTLHRQTILSGKMTASSQTLFNLLARRSKL
mmetsp:Transcript_29818/g.79293  ORF Transcript_29818/g.79293 Transcript_29818/m.79293 type:complete len:594 (-) Transcript_29818:33-1814(-)